MAEQLPMDLRRWLIQLGRLTATRISTDEAADYIEANEPMLAIHFPPAAFTLLSLEYVASQSKYLPTYGEITERLGEWWRNHRPKPKALECEVPPLPPLRTAEERAQAAWTASQGIAAIKATAAALRSSVQPEEDRRQWKQMTPEQLEASGFRPRKNSQTDGHNRA